MITLIMNELGLSFKDALEHASQLLGGSTQYKPHLEKKSYKAVSVEKQNVGQDKKIKHLSVLIEKSKSIDGTAGEKYLKGRAIVGFKNADLRFLETVTTGSGNKEIVSYSSALMAIARDENDKPKAIQLTYLDKKTGAKLTGLPISKRTLNSLNGASVNLTKNIKNPEITFIAEGIETALSIKDAAKTIQNAQVIATLGKSNLQNVPSKSISEKVVLVLDNDLKNPFDDPAIKKAISVFESAGKQVTCIYPEAINNKKTDYNDLAQAQKLNQITRDIERALLSRKGHDSNVVKSASKEWHVDMEREFLG